jgi:F0F1-type ATP synthase gamma subunit
LDLAILHAGSGGAELIVVGESGERYLKDIGKECTAFRSAADAEGRCALAKELTKHITQGLREERFGRVGIFYPNPVSFLIQKVEAIEIFPLTAFFSQEVKTGTDFDTILESPEEGIIEYISEAFIEHKLIELFEDSKLAEFAARAVHLERSGQELEDKKKQLQRRYFRVAHEIIDKNTRELFSSQIILKHKASDATKSSVRG